MAKTQTKSLVKPNSNVAVPTGYREFLNEVKEKIRNAQLKAAIAASRELIQLYWDIGKNIVEHGWSRSILTIWIENDLYRREGKAITNFKTTLPAPQSDFDRCEFFLAGTAGKWKKKAAF